MKIKLSESKIVAPWKTRIISLMQTIYTEGVTVEDVIKVYPTAPKKYILIAIQELHDEGVVEDAGG